MGIVRTITRNALSNFAGHFVHVIVGFLLTPYVQAELGISGWGTWQVIMAITGYYGMLDLGIRSAVGQYVMRYWAMRDMEGVSRSMSTSLAITSAIGVLIMFIAGTVAFVSPLLFESLEDANEMRLVILITGIGTAINFPLAIFQSATYATERFDIATVLGIAERLSAAGLYVLALERGWGLIGIAVVQVCVNTGANIVRLWLAYRLMPGLALTRKLVKLVSVKELSSFGTMNVLVTTSDLIVLNSDPLIIAFIATNVAVAYYQTGAYVISQSIMLINLIAWALTPYATACDTRGDKEALRRLWITGTRVLVIFASLLAAGTVFLGRDFLTLWVKPSEQELVTGAEFTSGAVIMAILAGTVFVRGAMACGKQILYGMQDIKFLARNSIGTALFNIVVSAVLMYAFGIAGVAVASVLAFAIWQMWFQPRHLARRLGMSLATFMVPALTIPAIVVATMGGIDWMLGDRLAVTGWGMFVARGFVLTTPAALLAVWIGLSHVEKDKLRKFARRYAKGRDPFTGKG